MAVVQEIANWVVEAFDLTESVKLDALIERTLQQRGVPRYEASSEAAAKADKVLAELLSRRPQELPFDFYDSNESRLIGKQRARPTDTPATAKVRERLALVPLMLNALHACNAFMFEKICAGVMQLSGASYSHATCSADDGGIDVYGRFPLRLPDKAISPSLLATCLLNKQYLFFGQCKRYALTSRIGRPDLDTFHGAVDHCLRQYEGNSQPPSHRVPLDFYRKNETCIRVYFTTSDFSDTATEAANALDIILINGRQIAEFLIYHKIGLTDDQGVFVDQTALLDWADRFGPLVN